MREKTKKKEKRTRTAVFMLDVVREINLFAQPIKAKKEKCALAAYFSLALNFQSIPQWPRVITSFKLGRKKPPRHI